MDEMVAALADVRKAYRLANLYIASLKDTVQKIAEEFSCNFYVWSPTSYEAPPRRSTNPFDRWAWDFLPIFNTSFLYLSEGADPNSQKPGDWLLDIYIETDSGFDKDCAGEPNPADFESVEESESSLTFNVFYSTKAIKQNWLYCWWNCGYPDEEIAEIEGFDGLKYVGRTYPLSKLFDEARLMECVSDFKQLVKDNLPLKDF